MERLIFNHIQQDLKEKIILLSGPRQVGKTTLAQSLHSNHSYLNYDVAEHRLIIEQNLWPKVVALVILDELHKMKDWKRWLKGIYDLKKASNNFGPNIIVTGSARLDIAKKMGDSLAGRHFSYRLNPLSIKELAGSIPNAFDRLMEIGGFPEPFLKNDLTFYRKWQTSHIDLILRQDLLDLEQVKLISKLETLVELLRSRVGSPCSYSSLSRDLQVDDTTIKRWLRILEHLFIIFKIVPYHKNVARAVLKTPKYYFYDIGKVISDEGKRFENLVALSLLSEIDFIKDTEGRKLNLNYLRNKEGNEIDFTIREEEQITHAIECKWTSNQPDKSFRVFFEKGKLKSNKYLQLMGQKTTSKEYPNGLKVLSAEKWLKEINL